MITYTLSGVQQDKNYNSYSFEKKPYLHIERFFKWKYNNVVYICKRLTIDTLANCLLLDHIHRWKNVTEIVFEVLTCPKCDGRIYFEPQLNGLIRVKCSECTWTSRAYASEERVLQKTFCTFLERLICGKK